MSTTTFLHSFIASFLRTAPSASNDHLTGPDLQQLEPELAHETARR